MRKATKTLAMVGMAFIAATTVGSSPAAARERWPWRPRTRPARLSVDPTVAAMVSTRTSPVVAARMSSRTSRVAAVSTRDEPAWWRAPGQAQWRRAPGQARRRPPDKPGVVAVTTRTTRCWLAGQAHGGGGQHPDKLAVATRQPGGGRSVPGQPGGGGEHPHKRGGERCGGATVVAVAPAQARWWRWPRRKPHGGGIVGHPHKPHGGGVWSPAQAAWWWQHGSPAQATWWRQCGSPARAAWWWRVGHPHKPLVVAVCGHPHKPPVVARGSPAQAARWRRCRSPAQAARWRQRR